MNNHEKKRGMLIANSASMIDHFNKDNIKLLQEKGYDITVAANFKDGNSSTKERIKAFKKELESQNIDIIDLPIPRKVTQLGKALKSISMLKRYMKEKPCDIIHTQTPFGGVVGRLAAKKHRAKGECKVIYFVHGFHFFKGASKKNYLLYYNIEKWLSKYTDCLITLNHEDFETASKKFKKTNVKYVPGVGMNTDTIHDLTVDKDRVIDSLHVSKGKKIILNVSELIPRKNVETCIKAFAAANPKETVLLICGKGAELNALKDLTKELGISEQVYFPGYRTDILDIYHVADAFLFTSHQEGLPVGVLQAMAAGLPIIASDIRGNQDLLNPYSGCPSAEYLTPVMDVDAYAEKLTQLMGNDSLRQTLGQENYENCKKYFDISYVHEKMSAIYDELTS